jgi:hypothetical protein
VAGLVGVPRPTDEDFIDVDNIDETSGASLLSERSKLDSSYPFIVFNVL